MFVGEDCRYECPVLSIVSACVKEITHRQVHQPQQPSLPLFPRSPYRLWSKSRQPWRYPPHRQVGSVKCHRQRQVETVDTWLRLRIARNGVYVNTSRLSERELEGRTHSEEGISRAKHQRRPYYGAFRVTCEKGLFC